MNRREGGRDAAMSSFAHVRSAITLPCVGLTAVLLVSLSPVPASANPTPEAMVFFDVRPAGSPDEYCLTDATRCRDLNPSTELEGLLEFRIFLDPQQAWNGALPVPYFTTELSWPETWTLVDYRYCRAPGWASFDPARPNPHHIEVEWGCDVPPPLFPVFSLIFDVQGYGRLDTGGEAMTALGCPAVFVYPTSHYAEAGVGCEYTDQPCVRWEYRCIPNLEGMWVQLTAPYGGGAHAEVEFEVEGYPYPVCEFAVNSDAAWLTGHVTPEMYEETLALDANASGLAPGVYETEVQLANESEYDGARVRVGRCLPVTLTVETSVSVDDGARSGAIGEGGIRVDGPNPSSGPFTFTYRTASTAVVRGAIYDASGREVAILVDAVQAAGERSLTWDARDASGRRVQPGVYPLRLLVDGEARSGRVVVIS